MSLFRFFTLILPLFSLLTVPSASTQNTQIDQVLKRRSENRISLAFSCTVIQQVPINLSGTLLVQGNMYVAKGNGLEIYCNGSTRWTVDPESKEVYIEDSGGINDVLKYRDTISELVVSDVKYLSLSGDSSIFSYDTKALKQDWIITDLRQE